MNKEMQDLFYELKQVLVQHSPKWNTLCDIEQYIIDLEKQLKEKQKIIDKILQIIKECKMLMPHEFDWEEQVENIEEILERGKEVKDNEV